MQSFAPINNLNNLQLRMSVFYILNHLWYTYI